MRCAVEAALLYERTHTDRRGWAWVSISRYMEGWRNELSSDNAISLASHCPTGAVIPPNRKAMVSTCSHTLPVTSLLNLNTARERWLEHSLRVTVDCLRKCCPLFSSYRASCSHKHLHVSATNYKDLHITKTHQVSIKINLSRWLDSLEYWLHRKTLPGNNMQ